MRFLKLSLLSALLGISFSFAQPTALAQSPTTISIPQVKCTPGISAFVMWNGATFLCVPLPLGFTLTGNVLTFTGTIYSPAATVEQIPFTNLAPSATSITYTTVKTPVTGVAFYTYNSTNLLLATTGFVIFTGEPITFNLPMGWTVADSISISYQSQ